VTISSLSSVDDGMKKMIEEMENRKVRLIVESSCSLDQDEQPQRFYSVDVEDNELDESVLFDHLNRLRSGNKYICPLWENTHLCLLPKLEGPRVYYDGWIAQHEVTFT